MDRTGPSESLRRVSQKDCCIQDKNRSGTDPLRQSTAGSPTILAHLDSTTNRGGFHNRHELLSYRCPELSNSSQCAAQLPSYQIEFPHGRRSPRRVRRNLPGLDCPWARTTSTSRYRNSPDDFALRSSA